MLVHCIVPTNISYVFVWIVNGIMVQKLWADIALVIIKFAMLLMIDSIANNWKQKKIYNTFLHNFVITSYLQFERLFYKSIEFKV